MRFRLSLILVALLLHYKNFAQCNLLPSVTLTPLGSTVACGSGSLGLKATIPAADTWRQKANYPGLSFDRVASFAIGNKSYSGFGFAAGAIPKYDFWEYDPATDVWTQKATIPAVNRKVDPATFTIGGKGYVGMGTGAGNVDFWEYTPGSNTWVRKADFIGTNTVEFAFFSVGGKGYVGTGYDFPANAPSSLVYEYDPVTDAWTQKNNFPGAARTDAVGFSIGTKGYLATGQVFGFLNDFWEYDPTTDTWTQKANYPGGATVNNTAFTIGSKGYVISSIDFVTGAMWQYDQVTSTWTQKSFTAPWRYGGKAISVGGKGYYGINGALDDWWEYSPELSYSWSTGAVTPSISVSSPGSYSLFVTDLAGCVTTLSQSFAINPLPTLSTIGTTSVCAGGSITLAGSGASTYSWTGGITNGVGFTPASSINYTLSGTSAQGCTNSIVVPVTVYNLPAVTALTSDAFICGNKTITLHGSGASTYTWTGGISDNTPFNLSTTTTYTLTGTDVNTCTNTAVKTITVYSLPTVTASVTNSVICSGALTTLNGGGASTYTWTGGIVNGSPFSPTVTATYTVTGTDVNTCTNTAIQAITVNNLPIVSATVTNPVICFGGTTAVNASGADTYTWTGGVTNGTPFSPAATTNYTVTGTDANSCTNTIVKTVTVNSLPAVTANATHPAICIGGTTALSGGGSTTYTWTGGIINSATFSPTVTTSYTVIGTDANTCTNTAVKTITVNNLPNVTASANTTLICLNNTVTLNGGGASTYAWTGGVLNNSAFSPTITTTYTVIGTDANTCTNTAVQTISVNNLPIVGAGVTTPVICIGGTTALNGSGALTYTWTNGVTDNLAFSPTITATYTVIGTDANTCTNTAVKTITVNNLPLVTANSNTNVICINNTVTLFGGGAVTYTWTSGVANNLAFSPTVTTTYTVLGTDANTCTNTAVKTISVNNLPVVTASASTTLICVNATVTLNGSGASTYTWTNGVTDGLTFSPTVTTIYTLIGMDANTCTNTAVQTISVNNLPLVTANSNTNVICINNTVTLFGGGAVTYTWTNGVTDNIAFSPTVTATYTVLGTDANTCTNTAVRSITVNNLPIVTAVASNTVICLNNTITLNGSGASTYTWTNGVLDGLVFSPTVTTTYTVLGTDVNTCTNTAVKTISVNNLPVVTASANTTLICVNATVTLNGSGASTYTWTNGVTDGLAFSPTVTTTYTVIGTDANTCTNTAVQTISVNNLPLVTANSNTNVICINNTVTLFGGGAVTYTWTNGVTDNLAFSPTVTATYTILGTDANTCTNTAVRTITVNNLPNVTASTTNSFICIGSTAVLHGGGALTYAWTNGVTDNTVFTPTVTRTYTVLGTDVNTCTNTAVQTITVNNLPIVTASAVHPAICIGGTTAVNGGGAILYAWTGGITNGSTFSPTITTTYTVTGTDYNTCTNTAVQTITVYSLPIVTTAASNTVICLNHTVTLNGGGAVTYTWTNGVTNAVAFTPTVTRTYTVTGTDVHTCTNTAVKTISVNNLPVVTASAASSVICLGDAATVNGNGAITYTWSSGVSNNVAFHPTITFNYTVTGTDANTCTNTAVQTVSVKGLPVVTATAVNPAICMNATTALNGGGAFTYTWTSGVTNGAIFSPTATASYTVRGTSAATGCSNTAVTTITVNTLPIVTANATHPVICINATTALNGAGASTYAWTNGVTNGAAFSPTLTTIYTVTGTDVHSCTNTAVQSVTVYNLPVVTAAVTNSVICYGQSTMFNASGALTYTWTGGVTDAVVFSPTATLTYTVTGTDINTCTNTAVKTITVHALPIVTANATHTVICDGASVTLSGGGASTYTWTNGVSNGTAFSPTLTATYSVTGTDINTCTNTAVRSVTVNPLPVVSAITTRSVVCRNEPVTFHSSGAATYTWTGGVTDGTAFTPTSTVSYSLTGTSSLGCVSINSVVITVTVNPRPVITINSGAICIGDAFTLTPGGASTYTYNTTNLTVTPSVTTSYSFTGTSAEGCESIAAAISTVTVYALPVIRLSAASSTLCFGKTTTITASGAATYTWSTGDNASASVITPSASAVYTVTGTSIHSCVNSNTVSLGVLPTPTVSVAADQATVCEGAVVSFTADGALTYSWSTGEHEAKIKNIPGSENSVFTVTGFIGSCIDTKTIGVMVNRKPVFSLGNDLELATGETYQMNVLQVGGFSFNWQNSEGLSSTTILNPEISIDHTVTYTLTITSAAGCSATDELTVTLPDVDLVIANYMSPNHDGKNDTWKVSNLYRIKTYSVEIFDGNGKTVFIKAAAYDNEFDANDLPDGVYYYFMKDGSKVKHKGSITVSRDNSNN